MHTIKPIFLFSLPRSGSTLVQRVLGAHADVATVSEPWLLLPFFYAWKQTGIYTDYYHTEYVKALDDFCQVLPNKRQDYNAALRAFALHLYSQAAPKDARYFLDKTPRYHLIAADLINAFPDAKFIFLWRNPLAVSASIMKTWAEGHWNLYRYKVDLYKGLENLTDTYRQASDKLFSMRYEDLVTTPETTWKLLFAYLDLPYEATLLESFTSVRLEGRMGDPTGIDHYHHLTQASLKQWKDVLANPLRKAWAKRYLQWIGAERLTLMGYEIDTLLDALDKAPTSARFLASDAVRRCKGLVQPWVEPEILRAKLRALPDWSKVLAHG